MKPQGQLIILRGNAASGKSTIASQLRSRAVTPTALIEQDYYRHQLLSPWSEETFALRAQLMIQDARLLLSNGCNVIIEGVLPSEWFGGIYTAIAADRAHVYYFDLSFEETVHRHKGRDKVADFGEEMLREWWHEGDTLGVEGERLIGNTQSIDDILAMVEQDLSSTR